MTTSTETRLAIDGGTPAIDAPPPAWPIADVQIREAIEQALSDHTWGTYHGRWLNDLCDHLSQKFACSHVHCCSSGTVAVELALRGVGINQDDEVILAGYDFPGNFRAVEAIKALPVLVDVVMGGWVMDINQLEAAVSDRTRAILVSHLHGQIADIPALRERLQSLGRADIQIVEDVCQSPGGRLNDRPLGTFGDASVLSFGGSKLLSAGRGGAVLTNDERIAQRVKIANDRGNEAYPLSQLQAIVLRPQLETLDSLNAKRNRNASHLLESVKKLTSLDGMNQIVSPSGTVPAYFKVAFLVRQEAWDRGRWLLTAKAEGLPVGAGFRGFANRSACRCRKPTELTNSKIASEQTVLLQHPILLSGASTIDKVAFAFEKIARTVQSEPHNA